MADKQLWQVVPVANDVKNDDGVIIGGQTAGTRYAPLTLIANFVHNLWAAFINVITPLKTSFANGDKFPVVNGSTATAMEAYTLLELTAQNALAGNVAPEFDESGSTTYTKYERVVRGGKLYQFNKNHSGAWSSSDVNRVNESTDLFSGEFTYPSVTLDNLTTVGIYRKTGDTAGILLVRNNANNVVQTMITCDGNNSFIQYRKKNSGDSWSSWVKMDIANYTNVVFSGVFDISVIDSIDNAGIYKKGGDTPGFLIVRKTGSSIIEQTLFTTDGAKAYIKYRNKSDGSWSSWVQMDVKDYQSLINDIVMSITDKVNTSGDNAKFMSLVPSVNIFDNLTVSFGKILSSSNGSTSNNANSLCSDYMPVDENTAYRFGYFTIKAFYNSSKEFISGVTEYVEETTTTPSGAAYARVSFFFNGVKAVYDYNKYMAYKVADAPTDYVPANERMLLGECPNHYANGIRKQVSGETISEYDVDTNLQVLDIEVRSKNLLNPTLKLALYNSSSLITVGGNTYANAFAVKPGESLKIGGDLSSFNSSAIRIGFTPSFPAPGMTMQGYQAAASGTTITVPEGCNWCFWTKGSANANPIISEAYITRNLTNPSYTQYVDVSSVSVSVDGLSLTPDAYGKVTINHRGNSLGVSSDSNVDFYVDYIRNLRDVLDEIGGADVSDIKFVGTGDAAYASAGKDQDAADVASSVAFGYGNMKNSGAAKSIVFGKENLQNVTGVENNAFGYHSQFRTTSGQHNSSFGSEACDDNTTGSYNTAVGSHALQRNSKGDSNVAIGYKAMLGGFGSFNENASFSYNIAIGYTAQLDITSGSGNIAIGAEALKVNASGSNNLAIGNLALQNASNRSNCIAIGGGAGKDADGNYQIWISSITNPSKTASIVYGEQDPNTPANQMLRINGQFELPVISTADPHIAGRLWNDNGTLKISSGNV